MLGIILIIVILLLIGHFFGGYIFGLIILGLPIFGLLLQFGKLGLSDIESNLLTFIIFASTIVSLFLYFNEESKHYRNSLKEFKLKIKNFSDEQKHNEIEIHKDFLSKYDPNKVFDPRTTDKRKYDLEFKIHKKYIDILQK